jgi:AraC-like DNA-binding protein
MRLVADTRELWRAPVGACVAGKRFLFFCARADLWGFVAWGDLDAADIRGIGDIIASEVDHDVAPHSSFVDLRKVASVDATFYAVVLEVLAAHGEIFSKLITRAAVVVPRGPAGVVAEGLARQVDFPHPITIHAEPEEALRSLGVRDRAFLGELETIQARVEGVTPLLRTVRAILDARPGRAPLATVAKKVGTSTRTLQRKLSEQGTTFQSELNRAQIARAQELLRGEATLTAIAMEVGCPSLQHFSALFRRMTGETPSAWRKARR